MSRTTKRSYNINYQLDCNSNNVVYLITTLAGYSMLDQPALNLGLDLITTKVGSEFIPGNLILTKKAMILSISIFMVLDIMDYGMLASRL